MNGEVGDPTPPASPYTEGTRLLVTGDFLWWIARENLLEYAFNADILTFPVGDVSSGSSMVNKTSVKKPDFEWAPGFRVGLGYRTPHDYWEAKARWTRFHPSSTGEVSRTSSGSNANIPIYNDGYMWAQTPNTTPIRTKWNLGYDLIELGLSRSFFLGKNLAVDMQFGAAYGWIDQETHTYVPNMDNGEGPQNFACKFSNDFNGGGLFLCMAPQWDIWSSLSVLGGMNVYLLHGSFNINQNWYNESLSASDMSVHKDYSRNRVGISGKLGLQWETSPLNCSYHFALAVAYEGAVWFKQNLLSQVMTFYTENFERRGDLEMQGITVSARADF